MQLWRKGTVIAAKEDRQSKLRSNLRLKLRRSFMTVVEETKVQLRGPEDVEEGEVEPEGPLRPWEAELPDGHHADLLLRHLDTVGRAKGAEAVEKCLFADGARPAQQARRMQPSPCRLAMEKAAKAKPTAEELAAREAKRQVRLAYHLSLKHLDRPNGWGDTKPISPASAFRNPAREAYTSTWAVQPPSPTAAASAPRRAMPGGSRRHRSHSACPTAATVAAPLPEATPKAAATTPSPKSGRSIGALPSPQALTSVASAPGLLPPVSPQAMAASALRCAVSEDADLVRAKAEGSFNRLLRRAEAIYVPGSIEAAVERERKKKCHIPKSTSLPQIHIKMRKHPEPPPRVWRAVG